ncbi:hypothetical protein IB242_05980 [Xanthomonas sp. XNM01]|nr:hypothetical protein [Xanthomonas sp. XNM01]MBD9368228.1 hypothetical protein [Xanthomonas sp. XNM01]
MNRAVGAAEDASVMFGTVADDPATAMRTGRRQCLDRAFEGVEPPAAAVGQRDGERLVVIVAAGIAPGHGASPMQ